MDATRRFCPPAARPIDCAALKFSAMAAAKTVAKHSGGELDSVEALALAMLLDLARRTRRGGAVPADIADRAGRYSAHPEADGPTLHISGGELIAAAAVAVGYLQNSLVARRFLAGLGFRLFGCGLIYSNPAESN